MNYDYVHNIKGLLVPKGSDSEMVAALVEEYVETIPGFVDRIRSSVDRRNDLEKAMRSVVALLRGVGARWLLNEAESILRLVQLVDAKSSEKKVQPFVANLLALSIEMQTAKHRVTAGSPNKEDHPTIEYYTDIQRNLSAVLELTANADYRSALDIVENMSVLSEDETGRMLASVLKSKRDPSDLIAELINKYGDQIDRIRGRQAGGQWKVLIVDDRPDILETVTGYLKDTYKVFALTGGLVALRFLETQQPDLFILDIDMPDMDGITLARNIRLMPEHRETPILILTSNATRKYVLSALQAGVNDFLVKPAGKEMLYAKISTFLQSRG